MGKKIITEDCIARCKAFYGDLYTYERFQYTRQKEKSVVTCRIHGDFLTLYSNFVKGHGCKQCSNLVKSRTKTKSTCQFISDAKVVHGDKYTYENTKYVSAKSKVDITCKSHGGFLIIANDLLQGKGCQKCGRERIGDSLRSTQEEFIAKCKIKHGDAYDYSLLDYVTNADKVKIRCNTCLNVFNQIASLHSGGQGCPECAEAGFKQSKSGWLYVLQDRNLTKLGITNNEVYKRVNNINSSGKSFNILYTMHFASGSELFKTEQKLLKMLKCVYNQPTEKFDGYTECFYDVNIADLLSKIEQHKGTTWKTTM